MLVLPAAARKYDDAVIVHHRIVAHALSSRRFMHFTPSERTLLVHRVISELERVILVLARTGGRVLHRRCAGG
jgi:hypothetical protein